MTRYLSILALFLVCAIGVQAGGPPPPEIDSIAVTVQGRRIIVSADLEDYPYEKATRLFRVTVTKGPDSAKALHSYIYLNTYRDWVEDIDDGETVQVTIELMTRRGNKVLAAVTAVVEVDRIPDV